MAGSKFRYNADPNTSGVPLRQDEVDLLLLNGGRVLLKDEAALRHFLGRVAATLTDQRSRLNSLQQDVSRISAEREFRGQPIARAIEALSALSEDEKRQLMDSTYLSEMDKLTRATEEAQTARTAAANEANRVKFALASVLEDPDLPAQVRQKIANSLAQLRTSRS